MQIENDPNFVRTPLYSFGTKTISTDSGIEYCVEYISEDKRQTRLLWFKESGEYIRLKAKLNIDEDILEAEAYYFPSTNSILGLNSFSNC